MGGGGGGRFLVWSEGSKASTEAARTPVSYGQVEIDTMGDRVAETARGCEERGRQK